MFDESKHPRDSDGKFGNGNIAGDKMADAVKKYSDTPAEDMAEMGVSKRLRTVKIDLSADIQKQLDNAKTPKERQKIAYRYIMENLCGEYSANDGRTITISSVGADKITHKDINVKLRVSPHLADFIRVGELQGVQDVTHKKFAKFAYYKVAFQMGDERYTALLNIGIRANGESTLYDINPFNRQ